MGRTETIKERSIYVYLPSVEAKRQWDERARAQGVSVSKFVVEHVENSLRQVEDPGYRSISELWREVKELREQLEMETREKHVLEVAMEKLEEELRRYRAKPFLDGEIVGFRLYKKELVAVLRDGRLVSSEEILARLGIRPSDIDAVRTISRQLEILESYGIVRSFPKGWRWTET